MLEALMAAIDAGDDGRLPLFAVADWHEERGGERLAEAWRRVARSDRSPRPPDEAITGWAWRHGCVCELDHTLDGRAWCSGGSTKHSEHGYIVGWGGFRHMRISPGESRELMNVSAPDFGEYKGDVRVFTSRFAAYRCLAEAVVASLAEALS